MLMARLAKRLQPGADSLDAATCAQLASLHISESEQDALLHPLGLGIPGLAAAEGWSAKAEGDLRSMLRERWTDDVVLPQFAEYIHGLAHSLSQYEDPEIAWLVLTRLTEAVRLETHRLANEGDQTALAELPLLDRAAFILISVPYRVSMTESRYAFGSTDELEFRLRRARERWAAALMDDRSHVALARFSANDLEREARELITGEKRAEKPQRRTLLIPSETSQRSDWWERDDDGQEGARRFVEHVICELFLRRFMVGDAWRSAWQLRGSRAAGENLRTAMLMPVGLMALCLTAVIIAATTNQDWALHWAALCGLGVYATAGLGILTCGPVVGDVLLLRLPAAAAIGAAAVIALDVKWWERTGWGIPLVVLPAIAVGYLAIEARGSSANGSSAALRACVVGVAGCGHSVAVSVVAIVWIGPFLSPNGNGTADWSAAGGLAQASLVAASVGLALGVFLQLLWEDRQVTYPLARPERRR